MRDLLAVIQGSPHLMSLEAGLYNPWETKLIDAIRHHCSSDGISEYRATVVGGCIFGTARSVYRYWRIAGCQDDVVAMWNTECEHLARAVASWAPQLLAPVEM